MNVEASTDQDLANQQPTDQEAPAHKLDKYLDAGYGYEEPHRGDIRTGEVLEVNDRGVVVDIGLKREGFVPAEDLTRLDEKTRSEVQVGNEVSVFVLRPWDKEGHPILSIHQACLHEDWVRAQEMMKQGELYEGEITSFNRGGLIVPFGKIRGFVPASQVVGMPRRLSAEERRRRMDEMVGERIGLKIIEVDRRRRRLIFSQRRALRAWQELQREQLIKELSKGEVRHGKVTDITGFGAFVDLGGADGLIHISELSWRRVEDPREVVKVGQELDVYVLNVDRERKRIALSLKKLEPDPWDLVDDHYHEGQLVEGKVTRVLDFGAFVQLDIGVEGLLHTSEMIGTPELSPSDIVHSGDTLLVKVVRIESRRRRIALSARQVRKSEWERWVAEQQAAQEEEAVSAETKEETVAQEAETSVGAEAKEEVPSPSETVSSIEAEEEKDAEAETAVDAEAEEKEAPRSEAATGEPSDEDTAVAEAEKSVTSATELSEAEALSIDVPSEAASVQ
jgi:small subunit ribosomal protein S1